MNRTQVACSPVSWFLACFAISLSMGIIHHTGVLHLSGAMFTGVMLLEGAAAMVFGLTSKKSIDNFGDFGAPFVFMLATFLGNMLATFPLLFILGE